MKRKQLPSIDISQSVMQRIKRDGIKMRPKSYFTIIKFLRNSSFALAILVSLVGIMSLVYVLKNDTFTDYKTLLGQAEFIKSLPWAGIVVTTLSVIAVILLSKVISSNSPKFKFSYALGIWLVLVVGSLVLANSLSPESTPSIIARTAYLSDKDPAKLYGEVIEVIDGNSLKVKVSGETIVVYTSTENIKTGDKILIIGNRKNGNFYAKVLEVTEAAPKQEEKKEENEEVVEMPKPAEPQPEPKTQPTPAPEPKPQPSPNPEPSPETTKTITIWAKTTTPVNYTIGSWTGPVHKIGWSSNFNLEQGYKLIWNKTGSPVYPGDEYYFNGSSSSGGVGVVDSELYGSGTYYVRACQYLGGSCGVYSNQITIEF
ncbi:NfeD family protein [Candidatus Saccharibacteria bacterium]|nr:NfeD family protein [Candidatus Saccharibacteria bacterium]